MIKAPAISVVMPIYNVEEYLKDAIDSVLVQSIGFEKNIELILVNDESPDYSDSICLDYARRYPNNIKYIKQKNQGVSMARRNGFLQANGEYIHFLDSDDTITNNYYKETVEFAEKHEDEIDLVATKIEFFEGKIGGHYLNKRIFQTRVINTNKEPAAIQNNVATAIIRKSALRKEWFDSQLTIGEDSLLAALIIKEKKAYGVVDGPKYNYRFRSTGGSAINTQHLKRDYYLVTPIRFWIRVLDEWTNEKAEIHQFAQHLVMNDIHWRINEQKSQHVLNQEEEAHYKSLVYSIISRLDDEVIIDEIRMGLHKRIHLLKRKYTQQFKNKISFKPEIYSIHDTPIFNQLTNPDYYGLVFEFITPLGGGSYFIEGYPTNDTIHPEDNFFIKTSMGEFRLNFVERVQRKKDSFLGDQFHNQEAFEATIELAENDTISAKIKTFTNHNLVIPIITGRHTRISGLEGSYRRIGSRIFKKNGDILNVVDLANFSVSSYELKMNLSILANIRLRDTGALLKDGLRQAKYFRTNNDISFTDVTVSLLKPIAFFMRNVILNFQSVLLRIIHRINKDSQNIPVWLISDRGVAAGDNGEALFRFINSRENTSVKSYFAISKKSADYKRMKDIGNVIDIGSFKYKLLFLRADKIISSHADDYVINPFGMRQPQLLDIYNFDYVFLQHGVTKNDISDWLNRFSKNIRLFVTVGEKEYNSILNYPFYYTQNEVLLSGFPRYDYLENKPENKIILAPTWRKYLTSNIVKKDGTRAVYENFIDSDYFKFYNDLMNDERIIDALVKNNAKGELYIHPSHTPQRNDFKENSQFSIKPFPYDYKTAFREGSLLITDYSSVYFDFAYLKKPIIYTQFDREYFFNNHGVYTEGYFDEARDGFGPVLSTYESAVQEIVRSIHANFVMENKYKQRVDDFFMYHDHNNGMRVYDAIAKIKND